MKILVTGASGQIGKRLVEKLLQENYQVRALVRNKTKIPCWPENIERVTGDLQDISSLWRAVSHIKMVIHAAAITHTGKAKHYEDVNVEGAAKLLRVSELCQVDRFILISTHRASYKGGAYAISKLRAEELVKKCKLKWTILRLAEVYGGVGNDMISVLAKNIKKHKFIPVIGTGKYLMNPLHIDDAINAIITVIRNEQTKSKIYNITGPQQMSFNDILTKLSSAIGKEVIRVHIPVSLARLYVYICNIFGAGNIVPDQIPRLLVKKKSTIPELHYDLRLQPRSLNKKVILKLVNKENSD